NESTVCCGPVTGGRSMELWIDGWMDYLLNAWQNATATDYLLLMVCVIVIGGIFNIHRSSTR
ncbi:MAG: hypothetical protein KDA70_08615, partial [Planctomycetaceae bacterium]|nr:hypothetical protein [Planctomycetaceae bacterium]